MRATTWTSDLILFILFIAFTFGLMSVSRGQEVADRPEYSRKWYLTVVYDNPASEAGQKLHNFLHNTEAGKRLVEDTNFNEWTSDMPVVTDTQWAQFLSDVRPAFILQSVADADGSADLIFFRHGDDSYGSDEFLGDLDTAVAGYEKYEQCRPCRPCRPRRPEVRPDPPKVVKPKTPPPMPLRPTIIRVKQPAPAKPAKFVPLWAYAFPFVGAALAVVLHAREQGA